MTKSLNSACWVILHAFWSSVDFYFKINFFKKIFQEYCQSVVLSGLIWVQTVCKGYQQMTNVTTSNERMCMDTPGHFAAIFHKGVIITHFLFVYPLYKEEFAPS